MVDTFSMSSKALDGAETLIDDAQTHVAEQELAAGVVDLLQSDQFSDESLRYKHPMAAPLNLSIAAHPPHFDIFAVFGRLHARRIRSRRARVMMARGDAVERLVRPFQVVVPAKQLQRPALSRQAVPNRRQISLQGAMHTLVAPVLIGPTGRDALERDAKLEQPYGESGQATERGRGKGCAVIAAQRLG